MTKKSAELGCHLANSNARNVLIRSAAIRVTPDSVPFASQISHVKGRSDLAVGDSIPQTVGTENFSGDPSAGLKLVVLGYREAYSFHTSTSVGAITLSPAKPIWCECETTPLSG